MSKKNICIVTVITAAIIIATIICIADLAYGDIVYPKTYIAEISLGGDTTDEAIKKIESQLGEFLNEPVVIVNGDETFEFIPEELGIGYDYEEIKSSLPTLWDSFYKIFTEKSAELAVEIDEEKLLNVISIMYTESDPKNAYLFLNTETDEVEEVREQEGSTLDEEALVEALEEKFANLGQGAITLPLNALYPEVTTGDLEPFKEVAKQIFSNQITIHKDDNQWIFSPNDHAHLITFSTKNTVKIEGTSYAITWGESQSPEEAKDNELVETSLEIQIDEEGLNKYIDETITEEVEILPENVIISMDENSVITFEGSAKNGISISKKALKTALELALENNIAEVEATTMTIPAGVEVSEELNELGITELIATGYTNFYGSPYNRQQNISVGMSKFNGVLVAPDETFSFIDTLGVVDASTGYYKELVITENETRPEYGGGLCQVSSTMFRAILYGGLPIVTRTEHSYAVSYYAYPNGYGLDATIYQPWPDLQFTNDTGNYILIQAYSEGNDAYFKFYGTGDDRTVTMDGPYYSNYVSPPSDIIIYTTELEPGAKQKEDSAHTGFDADWYRTVIYPDGTEISENIHSHYQAWAAKYLVGISEEEYVEPGTAL